MVERRWNGWLEEKEMRRVFREQAKKILSEPDLFRKSGDEIKIGFESEVAIWGDFAKEKIEATRDAILAGGLSEFGDKELGVAQIELRTPPINIKSPGGFENIGPIYKDIFNKLLHSARLNGASILRCGTNPFLPVKDSPRTNKPKYRQVPDFYNHHRRKDAETIIGLGENRVDIGDAAIVSLFQSFQTNLEANSFEDAIDKMNRSFMIAPYLLALGANSRYLEYTDTNIQDLRLMSWEKSHDTGMQDIRLISWERSFDTRRPEEIHTGQMLRVGLPEKYFKNMEEYLDRAGRFPFILYSPENALNIAIGMTWLDSRVKFIGNSLVVELRLIPTQPSIEEELLLSLLYIGRLRYSQMKGENLLPIEFVRANRTIAMNYGMRCKMWFTDKKGKLKLINFREGMRQEIKKAIEGLRDADLHQCLDRDLLKTIFEDGTPSDRLTRALREINGKNMKVRMEKALKKTRMLIY